MFQTGLVKQGGRPPAPAMKNEEALQAPTSKEKSKQNITRDIELKNIVTIATGKWGGDSGERGLQELL